MITRDITVTAQDGATTTAKQIVCGICGSQAFLIFAIDTHQHLQCAVCDTSYCDGSCVLPTPNAPSSEKPQ